MRHSKLFACPIAIGALWSALYPYTPVRAAGQTLSSQSEAARPASAAEEITLAVTVSDRRHHPVTNLTDNNFAVFEDGKPQHITSVIHDDGPASIGLLVDSSGSTRHGRSRMVAAMMHLVESGNPQNEFFVVNFADDPYLDQEFTSNPKLIREGMDHAEARGGTALYDAVRAAATHFSRAKYKKRALVIITDGVDTSSRGTLEQAIQDAQSPDGPSAYCIVILNRAEDTRKASRTLEVLAKEAGGAAFFPKGDKQINEAAEQIMLTIRGQYNVVYKPDNPLKNGGYRKVRASVRGTDNKELTAAVKAGYYASQELGPK